MLLQSVVAETYFIQKGGETSGFAILIWFPITWELILLRQVIPGNAEVVVVPVGVGVAVGIAVGVGVGLVDGGGEGYDDG